MYKLPDSKFAWNQVLVLVHVGHVTALSAAYDNGTPVWMFGSDAMCFSNASSVVGRLEVANVVGHYIHSRENIVYIITKKCLQVQGLVGDHVLEKIAGYLGQFFTEELVAEHFRGVCYFPHSIAYFKYGFYEITGRNASRVNGL